MIWLTGCKGMLGQELEKSFQNCRLDYVSTDSSLNICDYKALEAFIKGKNITCIVNAAAYTAVDLAEDEYQKALEVNGTGPKNLAKLTSRTDCFLIHISTDYVFDGNSTIPYKETDKVCPINSYGKSKLLGETSICKNTEKYYILRTSWLYGFSGRNFVKTMMEKLNSENEITIVNDQKGCPTNCSTLVKVIVELIKIKDKTPYGIYNVCDKGSTTWFDFCNEIKKNCFKYGKTGENCTVKSCTSEQFVTKAKRPAYSVLDTSKIEQALNLNLPLWQDSLENFIKEV